MRLTRLRLEHFRGFSEVEFDPGPGLNVLIGPNGAGKTSVLEAVHLMAYGRSFRGAVRDGLIRQGSAVLRVLATVESAGQRRQIGLERGVRQWQARIDGVALTSLADLYPHLTVVSVEPGSHALIDGGSDLRRRFLDWALFHVEPEFLAAWRRYHRALRQRNALLKQSGSDHASLEAWEAEMSDSGTLLTDLRTSFLGRWIHRARMVAGSFLPEAGAMSVRFNPGWSRDSASLAEALGVCRSRDLLAGHTTVGPHRADWTSHFERLPGRESYSRGQGKLVALSCLLAQADELAEQTRDRPVLCLDDLASELDAEHLARALSHLAQSPAQVLLTGTSDPDVAKHWSGDIRRFHVEPGHVRPLL